MAGLYIRRTPTRNPTTGERYFTHRLVRSERVGGKVRRVTLLNLGRHFAVPQAQGPTLCARLEEILSGQEALLGGYGSLLVEREAQRLAALRVARAGAPTPERTPELAAPGAVHSIEVDSLVLSRPRTVGVEAVGLWAMAQVDFIALLEGLGAPAGALVVMDRGIATAENLRWLRAQSYRYLVVSRERQRQFDPSEATDRLTAGGACVSVQRVEDTEAQEVRLYCYSELRARKEAGITARKASRFETELQALAEGLGRPRTTKKIDKLWERIGRLKEQRQGAGQHDPIEIVPDASGEKAPAIHWERRPIDGTIHTHPGVYCVRTNELSWDDERLWHTYGMLTDLEAVFRSLKSELGLRPIFHHKEERADGHLFITVLAYQLVQLIRRRLHEQGIHDSWASMGETLNGQVRVTATFRRPDGRALPVRKATQAEPSQRQIYQALGINPSPGGVSKLLV